ncbi:MAG: DUF3783 domain-containing protein [Desulfobacterales bacterium]|nr:DUF3783 domain-containing protein [Desulfobacterales bacterium]
MNDTDTFSRVARSANRLYGPRALLVCGFTPEGQTAILERIEAAEITPLSVVFATTEDLETELRELFARESGTGCDQPSRMPAAIIMAGISEAELHTLMERYRSAGLPWPLWATLTPTSETWTLRALLKELAAERAALAAKSSPGGD